LSIIFFLFRYDGGMTVAWWVVLFCTSCCMCNGSN